MLYTLIIISVISIMTAATAKALCDTIQFKFEFSKLKKLNDWWNPRKSWMLKYKPYMKYTKKHWWYLGLYKPTYDEKFAFSTTIFVTLTDAWHCFNFIHHLMFLTSGICSGLALSILLHITCLYLLLILPLYVVFALTFHIMFHNILK